MTDKIDTPTADTHAAPIAAIDPRLIETVPVAIEATIGRARMTVAQLSALSSDSVVVLDAALNQMVELKLNQNVIARGELVAVGDHFGVRLTEIAQWSA